LYQSTRSENRHPSYKSQSPRVNVLPMYASARRFFARLASEIFLTSLKSPFFSNLLVRYCSSLAFVFNPKLKLENAKQP
jgi:hypothetical protein